MNCRKIIGSLASHHHQTRIRSKELTLSYRSIWVRGRRTIVKQVHWCDFLRLTLRESLKRFGHFISAPTSDKYSHFQKKKISRIHKSLHDHSLGGLVAVQTGRTRFHCRWICPSISRFNGVLVFWKDSLLVVRCGSNGVEIAHIKPLPNGESLALTYPKRSCGYFEDFVSESRWC